MTRAASAGLPGAARPRAQLALETLAMTLAALTLVVWFTGRPSWPVWAPAGLLAVGLAARGRIGESLRLPRPHPETVACLAAAVAYRLPAILYPWAWVNRDGAYGAFVALHLLQGVRPAPVFTEGANYQGTLKGHLAAGLALVTGARDLSWLMLMASLLLYLVFLAVTMSLTRRLGGRVGAAACGIFLALSSRFFTVFSLNCVGQYVDVLALGGAALALVASLLAEDRHGASARLHYAGIGVLLGAAFWQQPVALAYIGAAGVALALRRRSWSDRWTLLVPSGIVLGALPVLLWNLEHGWASADILGRDPEELRAQTGALPHLVRRTLEVSFPILAGLNPGHPWARVRTAAILVSAVIPVLAGAYLALRGPGIVRGLRRGVVLPDLLPPLLAFFCLGLFWSVASGRVYWRPRYLLPIVAASAVHLGAALGWLWRRSRPAAVASLGALVAVNVAGALPRLRESRDLADYYAGIVRSLDEKGIRTGYADFSLSAPVTMFTAERIVLSPRLGPTPAYESEIQTLRVERDGPDAFLLRPEDDVARFAAALRALGVSFQLDLEPVPVFHSLSRRVRVEEVAGVFGSVRDGPREE